MIELKQDELKQIEKRLDEEVEYPETWQPKIGEKLICRVVAIREPMTSVGQRKVLEVETANGKKYTIWMRKVIESEIENKGIKVGDLIGMKYMGIPKGKRYHSYKIVKL